MLPIAAEIATRLTREQAQSARPDAPVIPDGNVQSRRFRRASAPTFPPRLRVFGSGWLKIRNLGARASR